MTGGGASAEDEPAPARRARGSLAGSPPPSTKPGTLRVGTAGFSYPDWAGPVFPRSAAGGARALSSLARWLDLLEVNVSHYRIPEPDLASSWLQATRERCGPSGFRFTAKLHRSYTHGPPAPTVADHCAMRAFFAALGADGRLVAVLAQFPPSFRWSDRGLAYVRRLAAHFDGLSVAVEFRDASWDRDDARDAIAESGLAWVVADLAAGPHAIPPRAPRPSPLGAPAPLAYVRLHGRSAAWYEAGVGRDRRYDYLYPRAEIAAWAERVARLRDEAANVVVVANNHFGGQAVANALELKALLGRGPVVGPASLVRAFPQIADLVTPEADPTDLLAGT